MVKHILKHSWHKEAVCHLSVALTMHYSNVTNVPSSFLELFPLADLISVTDCLFRLSQDNITTSSRRSKGVNAK